MKDLHQMMSVKKSLHMVAQLSSIVREEIDNKNVCEKNGKRVKQLTHAEILN